jgi:ribokinase
MRVAVIGHVEWVEFLRVDRVPRAGEIIHGSIGPVVPAGGGAVAAVQLARWGAETLFFTALGDDELGHRAEAELTKRGVSVHAAFRPEPQRRAVTLVDAAHERTIIVAGDRHVARADDRLPWRELSRCAAVYITGCDVASVRAARSASVVVATSRVLPLLREAAVELDALVGSANDPAEAYADDLSPPPRLVVRTDGAHGGGFTLADGTRHTWSAVPTQVRGDTYGAGDTFAAALAFALGQRQTAAEAVDFASRRAAEVLAFEGPYG